MDIVVNYLCFIETVGYSVEEVATYFEEDPKWFAGYRSKKLLQESKARQREDASAGIIGRSRAATVASGGEDDSEKENGAGVAIKVFEK